MPSTPQSEKKTADANDVSVKTSCSTAPVAPECNLLSTGDKVFLIIGTLLLSIAVPITWWVALRKANRQRALQGLKFSLIVIVISIVLYSIFSVWIAAVVTALYQAAGGTV